MTETVEQMAARSAELAEVRRKAAAGEQLAEADVVKLPPREVLDLVEAGRLSHLQIGATRRRR